MEFLQKQLDGYAPIQGGSSSSMDVLTNGSVVPSVSVEDWYKPVSQSRHMSESNWPVLVQLDRCTSTKAMPEALRYLRILYRQRLHFQDDPAGNRCMVS